MIEKAIDTTVCTRCGICKHVCPVNIIDMDAQTGFPFFMRDRDLRCTACGHCEAVCQTHAIDVRGQQSNNAAIDKTGKLSEQATRSFFKSRRSIRCYKPDQVPKETLEKLIDIVRYAPSGINRQPVEWTILYSQGMVKSVTAVCVDWMRELVKQDHPLVKQLRIDILAANWDNGIDSIARSAPHLIFAHAHKDDRMATTDGIIALSHIELAAQSFGIGMCWAGYLNIATNMSPAMKIAVGIPEDHACIGILMAGFPKYSYTGIPKRKPAAVLWK